jgi:hypothetical protein
MAETRKLAAILAADVVGFSKLAGSDEERTLARSRRERAQLRTAAKVIASFEYERSVRGAELQRRRMPSFLRSMQPGSGRPNGSDTISC